MTINGLDSQEAKRRLGDYGLNELPEKPPPSDISIAINQLKSPLVYILLGASLITAFLRDYTDTVVIGLAVLINTILGFIQEKKAGQALRALKKLMHPTARVIRDGHMKIIEVETIVPGDVVILNKGDKIPADGQVQYSNRFFVTEAMLTGESVPLEKVDESEVFMGTIVTSGQSRMIVTKTGKSTEIGKIALSLIEEDEPTPLKKQLSIFSRQLTILVLILNGILLVMGFIIRMPVKEIFSVSVALSVSAIPEGLLVGLTVVLAIGMQRILASKGLVRNLVSAETLGGVTTICVDKTGTLTKGEMEVVEVMENEEAMVLQTKIANDMDDPVIVAASIWSDSKMQVNPDKYKRLDSIPFDSETKYFISLHEYNDHHHIICLNGAPEVLINRCNISDGEKHSFLAKIDEMTSRGERVLGFARKFADTSKTTLSVEDVDGEFEWLGLIAFSDPVRSDVKEAFEKTKKAGIKLIVITGDYPNTAQAVLRQLGIEVEDSDIILGSELDDLEDRLIENKIFRNSKVKLFARTKPEQKMKIVRLLKSRNEVVAMMGDGVNDAPALAASDIGIVVGEATDVAKETADLVLLDSSFNTIILAIEEGRSIFENLRKMILYLLCDSFVAIILVGLAMIIGLPLPLTAAQILWINLVSDGFPNLALTIDPKSKNIMDRRPRPTSEVLVEPWIKELIAVVSVLGGIFAFVFYYLTLNSTQSVELARSVTFAAVGMNSLIYVYSIKALRTPFWKVALFNNKWLQVSVLAGLILLITPFVIPVMRGLFGIVPIGFYWIPVIILGILLFISVEITKWLLNHPKIKNKEVYNNME